MQLSPLRFAAGASLAAAAPVSATRRASAPEPGGESDDLASPEDQLPTSSDPSFAAFAGTFEWRSDASGTFVDFERLELKADGTYTAKVEATLVNPAVRCFRSPCTLPEQGDWNVYEVAGRTKLRVRPSTGPTRVYEASLSADAATLTLSRRGSNCAMVTAAGKTPQCVADRAPRIER